MNGEGRVQGGELRTESSVLKRSHPAPSTCAVTQAVCIISSLFPSHLIVQMRKLRPRQDGCGHGHWEMQC